MLAIMQRSEPPAISIVDTAGGRAKPYSVLFVCMGNICRSPTADGLFRHKVQRYGLEDAVTVDSAGTHNFHPGSPPDVRSQDHAAQRGYDLSTLGARQIQASDFDQFDLILEMDRKLSR